MVRVEVNSGVFLIFGVHAEVGIGGSFWTAALPRIQLASSLVGSNYLASSSIENRQLGMVAPAGSLLFGFHPWYTHHRNKLYLLRPQ